MNQPGKTARVFIVVFRPAGRKAPLVYLECLPGEQARQLARLLSISTAEGGERLEPWLNVEQAAEYLGFSDRAIRRWCRQGVLRHTLSPGGKNYRFRREWLDELLYAREQEPAIRRTVVERRARRRPEPVTSTFAERNPTLAAALAKANARADKKPTTSTKRGR